MIRPASIIALRGFALHDRQTPLFGRIGTYAYGGREQRVMFSEIDNRAGFHAGAYVKHDSGARAARAALRQPRRSAAFKPSHR